MSEQNVADAPSHYAAEEYNDTDYNRISAPQDFEPFDGGEESGQAAPGQGQSKSSRRRRRKRSKKVGEGGQPMAEAGDGSAPAPFLMEGESLALAAVPTAQPRRQQNSGQQNGQQQPGLGQGQSQGGKRWKKKFRDRERRPSGGSGRSENPGNDFRADSQNGNGGGHRQGGLPDNFGNQVNGFKRKNKGGGGQNRGFVGPMDHSYRATEFADAAASTISVHANGVRAQRGQRHRGDSQPIDHSMPRAIPIPEGAQTHIYFFIEELFFIAKIQETAKKLGVKVSFIKNDKDVLAELTESEENRPALIVFDLNNANSKPLTTIPKLKSKLKRSASIVGYLSHLQGDLKAKAVEAGCDVVMPRAAFSQNLPNLLRRYGVEEEEEVNYNY
jgi:hypothetical protein